VATHAKAQVPPPGRGADGAPAQPLAGGAGLRAGRTLSRAWEALPRETPAVTSLAHRANSKMRPGAADELSRPGVLANCSASSTKTNTGLSASSEESSRQMTVPQPRASATSLRCGWQQPQSAGGSDGPVEPAVTSHHTREPSPSRPCDQCRHGTAGGHTLHRDDSGTRLDDPHPRLASSPRQLAARALTQH
jgi:hypothetical protein